MRLLQAAKKARGAALAIATVARETEVPVSRVLRDTGDGAIRQGLNRVAKSKGIEQSWNRPRLESFVWPQWSRAWSDALVEEPEIESGDWSRTVFCAGFFSSGSSAIADCLYDSLGVLPPPRETVTFRGPRLPALIERSKSLRDFLLESVIGVSANPWDRRHGWLRHAAAASLLSQTMPASVLSRVSHGKRLSAARLSHAFLAPNSRLLVLDNALYREHTSVAPHFKGSQWILVLRDLPSQYAELKSHGLDWSAQKFCDFIELNIGETLANLGSMSTNWVKFDDFILDANYRERIVNIVQPGLLAKSSQYFRPDESAKNTKLGQALSLNDRVTLEIAERQIYDQIDFV